MRKKKGYCTWPFALMVDEVEVDDFVTLRNGHSEHLVGGIQPGFHLSPVELRLPVIYQFVDSSTGDTVCPLLALWVLHIRYDAGVLNTLGDPFKGFRADLDPERLWLSLFCHGIDSVYTWQLHKEEKIQRFGVFAKLNAQDMKNFSMEIEKAVHSKRDGNFIRVSKMILARIRLK